MNAEVRRRQVGSSSIKSWTIIGWSAIAIAAPAIPVGLIDGAVAGLLLYLAIVVGGVSGAGLNSTAKLGIASFLLCFLIGNVMSHYTTSTGFFAPTVSSVMQMFLLLAPPSLVSFAFMAWGAARRAKN